MDFCRCQQPMDFWPCLGPMNFRLCLGPIDIPVRRYWIFAFGLKEWICVFGFASKLGQIDFRICPGSMNFYHSNWESVHTILLVRSTIATCTASHACVSWKSSSFVLFDGFQVFENKLKKNSREITPTGSFAWGYPSHAYFPSHAN